jgi:hypothetical protein
MKQKVLLISANGGFTTDVDHYNIFLLGMAAYNMEYSVYAFRPNVNSTALSGTRAEHQT